MSETKPAKPKKKKALSEFEIFRLLTQRLNARRLPYLYSGVGEPSDVLVFGSMKEEDLLYGSYSLSIGFLRITDPELRARMQVFLDRINYPTDNSGSKQWITNIRDQVSDLAKTKGEALTEKVHSNEHGTLWVVKKQKDKTRDLYYRTAIESLFRFQCVSEWCDTYLPLLTETPSVDCVETDLPEESVDNTVRYRVGPELLTGSVLGKSFKDGITTLLTKGKDIFTTKPLAELNDDTVKSALRWWCPDGDVARVIHVIRGAGWEMGITRPNLFFIP